MAEPKIIRGQAWISGNSLIQDIITITENGSSAISTESTETIVENIWTDLTNLTDEHNYETNNKGYFYWKVNMTSLDNDDETVEVYVECPRPDVNIDPFRNPEPDENWTPEETASNYAKYWITKLAKIMKQAENEYAIQRKEVIFHGGSYLKQDQLPDGASVDNYPGEGNGSWNVEIPDYTFNNSDIGDITNLLSLF